MYANAYMYIYNMYIYNIRTTYVISITATVCRLVLSILTTLLQLLWAAEIAQRRRQLACKPTEVLATRIRFKHTIVTKTRLVYG